LLVADLQANVNMRTDSKDLNPDEYLPPREDELSLTLVRDWTEAEEKKAKRKYELLMGSM
jgi:hypothetical protein